MDSRTAQKTFELTNNIRSVDAIYAYDGEQQKKVLNARPWRADPHHFKYVQISAVALIKMVMHARSGGQFEIMGLMQGKIENETFVVMDAFALPVLGTETRVNAGSEGDEYSVQYQTISKSVGRPENVVGWYHSHPGYGCWLSGIDVTTQLNNQMFLDPFLAIVIDPNRTISAGKVEIGAFRAYPKDYTPPNAVSSDYQSIPLDKVEDFGVHSSRYYPLSISHFKSSLDTALLDLLWNKYWVTTLSQSPLITNRSYMTSQITDLVEKLSQTEGDLSVRSGLTVLAPEVAAHKTAATSKGKEKEKDPATVGANAAPKEETSIGRVVKESKKIAGECHHGLVSQILKDMLFNRALEYNPSPDGRKTMNGKLHGALTSAMAA